jgi:hypothetical protein
MNRKKVLSLVLVAVMTLSMVVVVAQYTEAAAAPVFTCVLIAPTNNPVRVQHAQLIANELPKIGIGVTLLLVGWDILIPRLFQPEVLPYVKSYADGGYDLGCVGWSGGLTPVYQYYWFHSAFIPDYNFYNHENSTYDDWVWLTMNTTDFTQRKAYIKQAYEYIVNKVAAEVVLYQVENCVYMRDNLRGYSSDLRVPQMAQAIAEMYFEDGASQGHGNVNELIYGSTTPPNKFNDFMQNDWYNTLALGPINHAMVSRDPDYNYVPMLLTKLPYPVGIKNNHTGIVSSTDPNFATVWEIEMRDDMYWHEGYGFTMAAHEDTLKVDADDVIFTYDLTLDENGPTPWYGRPDSQLNYGEDVDVAIIKKDRYHVQFHMTRIYADIMGIWGSLYPKHVLELGVMRPDGSQAPTDYADWNTDDWYLGQRSGGYTGPAVIGNGPYMLTPGWDPVAQTVTEDKNEHWFLIDEPEYANMPDKWIVAVISSKDAALIALEQAHIDFMDPQFHAEKDYPVMKNKPNIEVFKALDWGCQTMGINMKYGAGGILADLNVRLAIQHMMPRQDMVDFLLGGLGQVSYIHTPQQNPFYPQDLHPMYPYNFTKALDYMEAAGYDMEDFRTTEVPTGTPGFEALAFFIALGGMAAAVLVYRHKKRIK